MLEDRPTEEERGVTPEEDPAATTPFNPLYAVGGVVIAALTMMMAVSGLLIPALLFVGVIAAFIGVQVVIFRVFPPSKS